MTIIIDSIVPNRECLETPPSSATTDRCVEEVHFHLRHDEGGRTVTTEVEETIPFHREASGTGASFYLSSSTITPSLSGMISENRFDPAETSLQRDLVNMVNVRVRYAAGRELIVRSNPSEAAALGQLFDDLVHFIFVGEIDSPDEIQQETNSHLVAGIAGLSAPVRENFRVLIESFLFDNREWLRREDAAALPRVEFMASVLNFTRRISEVLSPISADTSQERHLRQVQGEAMAYLLTGRPPFPELSSGLALIAQEIYLHALPHGAGHGERINLFPLLLPAFHSMEEVPPFNEGGSARTRLALLTRWLEQPAQTRNLEYSALEPHVALIRSVIDSLLVSPETESLLSRVHHEIDAEWLRGDGHLEEVGEALLGNVTIASSREGQFQLRWDDASQLRERLQSLFDQHAVGNREFVAAALALLRIVNSQESLRVFHQGQMRDIPWQVDAETRRQLDSLDHWMESQIHPSLTETDWILPTLEGVVCAAGIGLTTWGALTDRAGEWNAPLIAGGGTSGLGCSALATHFIFDTQDHWISDSIGGLVGTVIGVGIPLLLHFLLGSGAPMPPMDGRGPSIGFGP
jgi:hypothetical protein